MAKTIKKAKQPRKKGAAPKKPKASSRKKTKELGDPTPSSENKPIRSRLDVINDIVEWRTKLGRLLNGDTNGSHTLHDIRAKLDALGAEHAEIIKIDPPPNTNRRE